MPYGPSMVLSYWLKHALSTYSHSCLKRIGLRLSSWVETCQDRSLVSFPENRQSDMLSVCYRPIYSPPDQPSLKRSYTGFDGISVDQAKRLKQLKQENSCLKRLVGELFYSLNEARILIEQWHIHYNMVRPHRSIGRRPSAPATWDWRNNKL